MIVKIFQILSILVSATRKITDQALRRHAFIEKKTSVDDLGMYDIRNIFDLVWDRIKFIDEIVPDFNLQNHVETNLIESCLHKHTASGNLLSTFVKIRPKEFRDTFFQEAFTDKRLLTLVNSERFPVELKAQARKVIRDFSFYRDILIAVLNNGVQQENTPSLVDLIDKAISLHLAGNEDIKKIHSKILEYILEKTISLIQITKQEVLKTYREDVPNKFDALDSDFIIDQIQKIRFSALSSLTRHDVQLISSFIMGKLKLGLPDNYIQKERVIRANEVGDTYFEIVFHSLEAISNYIQLLLMDTNKDPDGSLAIGYFTQSFKAFRSMVAGIVYSATISEGLNKKPIFGLLRELKNMLVDANIELDEERNALLVRNPKLPRNRLNELESFRRRLFSRWNIYKTLAGSTLEGFGNSILFLLNTTNHNIDVLEKLVNESEIQAELKREIKEKCELVAELGKTREEQHAKVVKIQNQLIEATPSATLELQGLDAELKMIQEAEDKAQMEEARLRNELQMKQKEFESVLSSENEWRLKPKLESLREELNDYNELLNENYQTILGQEIEYLERSLKRINEKIKKLHLKPQNATEHYRPYHHSHFPL